MPYQRNTQLTDLYVKSIELNKTASVTVYMMSHYMQYTATMTDPEVSLPFILFKIFFNKDLNQIHLHRE